jgi:succinyl-CoA synthetase alpha subunit
MNWIPGKKILVQGITTSQGAYYAAQMKAYGTEIVAGISTGQRGQFVADIPIFDLVEQAITAVGQIDTSLIFVESYHVLDVALEAIAAGIRQLIIISKRVPPLDMIRLLRKAESTNTLILGPGSSGLIIPQKLYLGTCEPQFYTSGSVGIISRTDILTDEVAWTLTKSGIGQSLSVNIGTEGIVGSCFEQWLEILEKDEETKTIILLGYPNSLAEETAAEYIIKSIQKPVIAYIPGEQTPSDYTFADAATIIAAQLSSPVPETNSLKQKITILQKANVKIAKRISQIPILVKKVMK